MGGVVAFEVAQQLRHRDREISLLTLLDSEAVDYHSNRSEGYDDPTLVTWFAENLSRLSGKDLQVSHDFISSLRPDQRSRYVLEQAKAAQILPREAEVAQIEAPLRVFKANIGALCAYFAHSYTGRIAVLRTHRRPEDDHGDPTLGWGSLADTEVEVHWIPGNHYSIMTTPHVRALGRQLGSCLAAAQGIDKGFDLR